MKNQKITDRKKEIVKALNIIEKFNASLPEGEINVSKDNKYVKFQQRIKTPDGKIVRNYLARNDKLLKTLSTKKYYKKIEPVITKELKALEKQEKDYWPNRKYEVYEELGELKEFVKPLFTDDRQKTREEIERKVKNWIHDNSSPEEFMEEGKKFKTSGGEKTRSKSEWMIIAILDRYSDYLKYVYEPEHYIPGKGLMRPDFEIISLKTGKVYFWEHVGMLGEEEYASKFVEKINKYALGGYFPGKNLILSFESATQPLDVAALEEILNEYFVKV